MMISDPILEIKGLTKSFGGVLAINNVDFHVSEKGNCSDYR